MSGKINVSKILTDHFGTFRHTSGKVKIRDYLLFIGVPVIITAILIKFGATLERGILGVFLTCYSIFIALLLNLLLLIYDIMHKVNNNIAKDPKRQLKKKFIKEVYSNVSFSILLSIILIIVLVLGYIENLLVQCIVSAIIYFLSAMFILSLFMILKRVYILLSKEMD